MIGVSFQPGQNGNNGQNGQPSAGSGVQEAIRILSLRLPRVLGAQRAAAMPLLTSQGSGGNPRVDSIVNQVLSRVMPGQQMGMGGPNLSGSHNMLPQDAQAPWTPPGGFRPRVIVDSPQGQAPRWPGQSQLDGGAGQPPGMFGSLPPTFQPPPPIPNVTEPIFRREQEYTGGYDSPSDLPMF